MNILKTLTAEDARQLVELHDLGVSQTIAKELSDKIYVLAKRGNTDAKIYNVPPGYVTYLRSLGYDVTQITNDLIQISWL